MRYALIFFGLLCSCTPTVDPPAIVPKSYTIPFTMGESKMMVVMATIDLDSTRPHPTVKRLAIDTGSAHTCFFAGEQDIAALVKTVPGAASDISLASDGQIINTCKFKRGRIMVGNLKVDLPIYASAYDMGMSMGFDGSIGQDFLSRFTVQIDYQARLITLTPR